jgi:hypothetical protein
MLDGAAALASEKLYESYGAEPRNVGRNQLTLDGAAGCGQIGG